MKKAILLLALVPAIVKATVTINVQIGELYASDNSPAAIGSYAVLVSDTGNDGFVGDYTVPLSNPNLSAFASTTLGLGNFIASSNDKIIGVYQVKSVEGYAALNDMQGFAYGGGLSAGQALGLYWFPSLFTNTISGSVAEYGFYRSDAVDTNALSAPPNIAFIMPADGANVTLATWSVNLDGSAPTVQALTAVPEPATYAALLGALALGVVIWRRRRA